MAVRLTSSNFASYCSLSKSHYRQVAFFIFGTSVMMVTKPQLLGAKKWPQYMNYLFPDMAKKKGQVTIDRGAFIDTQDLFSAEYI